MNRTWTVAAVPAAAAMIIVAAWSLLQIDGEDRSPLPRGAGSTFGTDRPLAPPLSDIQRGHPDEMEPIAPVIRPQAAGTRQDSGSPATEAPDEPLEAGVDLRTGGVLEGRVLDRTGGTPIAGVRVAYYDPLLQTSRFAVSDSDGTFRLGGLASGGLAPSGLAAGGSPDVDNLRWGRGGYFTVAGRASGECVGTAPDRWNVDLFLVEAASASGRVLDAAGRPVPGAPVFAYDCVHRSSGCRAAWMDFTRTVIHADIEVCEDCVTCTDEQGWFTLDCIPPEVAVRIAAVVADHAAVVTCERIFAAGEDADGIVLAAVRGALLQGEVVDERGTPVGAAVVDVYEARGECPILAAETETDRTGRFTVPGLEPGSYTVRAYRQGRGSASAVEVVLRSEESENLRFILEEPASTVAGRVTDSKGRAVPGIRITCIPDPLPEKKSLIPCHGTSTADGTFRIAGLWQDVRHMISADDPQGVYIVHGGGNLPAFVMPGATGFEIKAYRAASVSGRVEGIPPGTVPRITLAGASGSRRGRITVAEIFRIERILPGTYDVVIDGRGLTRKTVGLIDVAEGDVLEELIFHYGATTAVSGVVVIAGAWTPVAGIRVTLYDPLHSVSGGARVPGTGTTMETTADTSGRFRFAGIQPGTYALTVWDPAAGSGTLRNVTVVDGEELAGLEIAVLEGVPVSGRVELAGGRRPDTEVRLCFLDSDRITRELTTRRDGSFSLRLVPGRYVVAFRAAGSAPENSGARFLDVPQDGLKGIVIKGR